MKIVIIGPAHPFRGGIATFTDRLAQALQEDGHEVVIHTFTLQYPGLLFPGKTQYSEAADTGVTARERSISSINPITWMNTGRRLAKQAPDLVIFKFWMPFFGPAFGTIARRIRKNKTTRMVALVHNMIPHESRPGDPALSRYFVNAMDGFIALSEAVLKDIATFDATKPKIYTPHPLYDNFGAPKRRETLLDKFQLAPDAKVLLFFGLIRDYKGLDLLIEAYADKRIDKNRIKLIVAGEYYGRKSYYTGLIEKFGLESVIIQHDRFIPDDEVADYFSVCDLVVQPYKSATQSGITQIAYHFEKPMIVTSVGGLAAMCPDGKVGYVVDPKPTAIADAILKFFELPDPNSMIKNIVEEKKKYSWQILTSQITSLYDKIAQ